MIKINNAFPLSSKALWTVNQGNLDSVLWMLFQTAHCPRIDTQIFYSTEVISISSLQPAQKCFYSTARKCYSSFSEEENAMCFFP